MSELNDEKFPAPHPDAAIEEVEGRLMIATPDEQLHYFVEEDDETPSEVGEFIMRQADGTRTIREIAHAVCEEFDGVSLATALQDAREFVQRLVDKGVLELKDAPTTP